VFTVGQGTVSDTPLDEFATIYQKWTPASPQSIGAGNWTAFSGACWFFGKNLYDRYKVPIGLLSDNWGGTYIQTWMSPVALQKCTEKDFPLAFELPKITVNGADPNKPSVLWNAMITPILPMTVKGFTWYQGESNSSMWG
jgi:sialate O-acetylesterase